MHILALSKPVALLPQGILAQVSARHTYAGYSSTRSTVEIYHLTRLTLYMNK